MIFEGSHSVIQAIKEKKRLMDAGLPHEHIRPLLIQGGGLMRGAYGVGGAIALEEMGLTNCFTSLVGISSGAPTISYFAAGLTQHGLSVLLEDCCDARFINPWRFWKQVDTKHFIDIVRTHPEKRIPVERVLANPAAVYFGVTEYKTAKPRVLKPKNTDYFFKMMHASINMQNVSPCRVIIDGVHYTDGGFSRPHVIVEAVAKLQPTHTLVVTNNDQDFSPIPPFEQLLNRSVYRLRLNGILARAMNTRREARDAAIASIMPHTTAVVWGDGSIGGGERNKDKIAGVVEASRAWWHGLFSLEK